MDKVPKHNNKGADKQQVDTNRNSYKASKPAGKPPQIQRQRQQQRKNSQAKLPTRRRADDNVQPTTRQQQPHYVLLDQRDAMPPVAPTLQCSPNYGTTHHASLQVPTPYMPHHPAQCVIPGRPAEHIIPRMGYSGQAAANMAFMSGTAQTPAYVTPKQCHRCKNWGHVQRNCPF